MTLKADKLPLETEPAARDNNTILTLKPGDQTLSRLTQLIIVVTLVCSFILFVFIFPLTVFIFGLSNRKVNPAARLYDFIFTIQYPVPLFSLCTKSLIAVLKDAKQLSEENGGGPFCWQGNYQG